MHFHPITTGDVAKMAKKKAKKVRDFVVDTTDEKKWKDARFCTGCDMQLAEQVNGCCVSWGVAAEIVTRRVRRTPFDLCPRYATGGGGSGTNIIRCGGSRG